MNPPVRVVCRGCLRSVELDAEITPSSGGSCPHCGQAIDSRLDLDGPTDDGGSSSSGIESHEGRGPTSEWVATWSRGSLGMLGRFQIRERLGDGGFGEVYLAYDPRLDRDIALKVLRQANPSDRVMERFFREARAAARLDHPNIVAVYDSGFDHGRCWVAYQKVTGRPLWWYLDHQPIESVAAARMLRDLAEAVDYAHKHGVVHRDIKPANILIDDAGRPRLIDFGLARRADLDSDLTREGAVVGTPAYMSPEQALGHSRQVDERSDVYSLGVVMFETLAGRGPNSVSTVRSPATPVLGEGPSAEEWAEVERSVPAELVRICKRATAKRPDDRYPIARELADDLTAWIKSQDLPTIARKRRHSAMALGAWSVVVACLLAAGYAASRRPAITPPPTPVKALASPTTEPEPKKVEAAPAVPPAPNKREAEEELVGDRYPAEQLIRSTSSDRYHKGNCQSARLIPLRSVETVGSLQEATEKHLIPCLTCKPQRGLRKSAGVKAAAKNG